MPIPKNPKWVTFDVYGTLIDWESGVKTAFATEAKRSGFEIEDPNAVFDRFVELQHEIESGSYELYAEVLRRVAMQIAEEKQAVAQYGSSDSGASLGDILGEALKARDGKK